MKTPILILNVLMLTFSGCITPKNDVKRVENPAPMNPLVAYIHKDQLMLQGAVKVVGENESIQNERYDQDGNMTYNYGETYIHSKDKIIHDLGTTTITYYKDEHGKIYKAVYDELGNYLTNYTYNKKGLLIKEYGTENDIDFSTSYEYDTIGRVKKSSYNYGEDPVHNIYYAYKDLGNNILQITITYNDEDQNEIYEYTNGYMTKHERYGKKTAYTYTWDKHGNWLTQTVSEGGKTERKITYYN